MFTRQFWVDRIEAAWFAIPCEVSRTTISNYLGVLEVTKVAHLVRPFSTHRRTEIVAAPKVYAFDTGFVAYYRNWTELRHEDLGALWEHYVLNELNSQLPALEIRYWRDTRGHEVDFVVARRGQPPAAIECKWSLSSADRLPGLQAFRRAYPQGENFVVATDVDRPFQRRQGDLQIRYVSLKEMIRRL